MKMSLRMVRTRETMTKTRSPSRLMNTKTLPPAMKKKKAVKRTFLMQKGQKMILNQNRTNRLKQKRRTLCQSMTLKPNQSLKKTRKMVSILNTTVKRRKTRRLKKPNLRQKLKIHKNSKNQKRHLRRLRRRILMKPPQLILRKQLPILKQQLSMKKRWKRTGTCSLITSSNLLSAQRHP